MKITNATALVTGANRGIGREFARQLVERGAMVYATARRPETIDLDGVKALALDITDPDAVRAVAEAARDVDLLINNAGITTHQNLLTGDLELVRAELDTHFYGTLAVTRAFAPILGANGGGGIINVLSNLSFRAFPNAGAYAVGKAAEWMLTNSTRLELADQGTQVLGLHLAATDTDMMAGWDIPKNRPEDVVSAALDGLEAGLTEVLVDDDTRQSKALLSGPPEDMYPDLARTWRD
ncbi:SDR family oxidoreductase [Kribbella sp. CA-293567]|uniref:SDR family oxidoreductase n=1 Tax=Kribbella sp. CA-293567 TaxID=3002436 RepID=UPI0022DE7DC5|nr:SDR family oxidoreductase [Kribbella sp. CA-293567]WBQ05445.1 SDR family oxidoreductase [Kribbella sp. CA-293567]